MRAEWVDILEGGSRSVGRCAWLEPTAVKAVVVPYARAGEPRPVLRAVTCVYQRLSGDAASPRSARCSLTLAVTRHSGGRQAVVVRSAIR